MQLNETFISYVAKTWVISQITTSLPSSLKSAAAIYDAITQDYSAQLTLRNANLALKPQFQSLKDFELKDLLEEAYKPADAKVLHAAESFGYVRRNGPNLRKHARSREEFVPFGLTVFAAMLFTSESDINHVISCLSSLLDGEEPNSSAVNSIVHTADIASQQDWLAKSNAFATLLHKHAGFESPP